VHNPRVASSSPTKACPDCAEQIQAQAKVCRFCGYRYAEPGASGAFSLRRTPPAATPLPELLLGWGVELADGEDVAFFTLGREADADGYLLVTSARVIFFVQSTGRGRFGRPAPIPTERFNVAVDQLSDVEAGAARWGRRWLHVAGPNAAITLTGFTSKHSATEVASYLRTAMGR
jgi:hypothetical protein